MGGSMQAGTRVGVKLRSRYYLCTLAPLTARASAEREVAAVCVTTAEKIIFKIRSGAGSSSGELSELLTEGLDRKLHLERFKRTLERIPDAHRVTERPRSAPSGGRRDRSLSERRDRRDSTSSEDSEEVTFLTVDAVMESPRGTALTHVLRGRGQMDDYETVIDDTSVTMLRHEKSTGSLAVLGATSSRSSWGRLSAPKDPFSPVLATKRRKDAAAGNSANNSSSKLEKALPSPMDSKGEKCMLKRMQSLPSMTLLTDEEDALACQKRGFSPLDPSQRLDPQSLRLRAAVQPVRDPVALQREKAKARLKPGYRPSPLSSPMSSPRLSPLLVEDR